MSSVLTPRACRTSYPSKSSPTGPTTRTSVKKLAAREKCTAEPPSMRSRSPNGVLTESNAIEPTAVSDKRSLPGNGLLGRQEPRQAGRAGVARHLEDLAP